jgi:hypothetical protein
MTMVEMERREVDQILDEVQRLDALGEAVEQGRQSEARRAVGDLRDRRISHARPIRLIYLADEEPTAWAEWYRGIAELGLPPTHGMPRDLWRWMIAVNDIADLSTPAKLARLDLPTLQPSRGNWLPFQVAGEELHREGVARPTAPASGSNRL